ncbi:MAG TPA: shikimate kinase [Acidimicrobiia bacterium]|nr:shikimate kinase [Acidimicrobiia bacterium]
MRVSVIGSSGSGKTTFGRTLAARLGVAFLELDSVYHQANWTPLPAEEFRERVQEFAAGDAWVIDGNYGAVRPVVLERATTVVWLDYRRSRIMTRVIRRSIARAIFRRELWNGNREEFRFFVQPDHPIRWAWAQHHRKRVEYAARFAEPQYGRLELHRFRTPRDATRWLDAQS